MTGPILITGGAGFIGSALVRQLVAETDRAVVTVDKLTYAGHRASLEAVADHPRHHFERADIGDRAAMGRLFARYRPGAVMHLAAESHVDRSIDGPAAFIETNVGGTYTLLEAARVYRQDLAPERRDAFRFLHVSTDEVYGALGPEEAAFTEATPYAPRSPYAASKASSDHLARAWRHTYGLPVVVTNCSNNYGPRQYPEKLIPVVLLSALRGRPIPVYGAGENVRDWLFVEDHARALRKALEKGQPGETYLIGGHGERSNIEIVRLLCRLLDAERPRPGGGRYAEQITFVEDRPGHDFRYAVDPSKAEAELGWRPQVGLEEGLRRTVRWYLDHLAWCEQVTGRAYDLERLGLGA